MKRHGDFWTDVCTFGALIRSAHEAAKGKKDKPRIAHFLENLENEIIDLERELLANTYKPRSYRTFTVHDPKDRRICAADFRDRVAHHAVCRVLEPIFERAFIYDTYACRKDKGTHKAIRRAQHFCRRHEFFLKLDIRKFFDSVDHGVMKSQLRRKVKDPDLLWLLVMFVDHPVPWTPPGKGLPIGNLTSQYFANFHLSGLDHFIKERLRIRGYVRYMDDLVLLADEKQPLWDAARRIEDFLEKELLLKLKEDATLVSPTYQGLPFLGLRIFPGVIRLSRPTWRRFRRRMIDNEIRAEAGLISEEEMTRSALSLVGHIQHANTYNLRRNFFMAAEAKQFRF